MQTSAWFSWLKAFSVMRSVIYFNMATIIYIKTLLTRICIFRYFTVRSNDYNHWDPRWHYDASQVRVIIGSADNAKSLGKFDWGVWYVIIFLYVQFWIRLAAVSYRGKKVRNVAFPAVRWVNKSSDTRNCVQNKPEYPIHVIFTTRSYYKDLGLILCYLI